MLQRASSALALVVVATACAGAPPPAPPPLVPLPRAVSAAPGRFPLDAATPIRVPPGDPELAEVARVWSASVADVTGPLRTVEGSCVPDAVCLRVTGEGAPESYALAVTPDSVLVAGADHAGVFYGLQTLAQLLPPSPTEGPLHLAGIRVDDAPRFPWRGMHLDVARHFFGPGFVKRYIDQLARYKLNRFHWHLTDDQGWRIEIRRYPRLTEVGAWRAETMVERNFDPYLGDGVPHGGYYTQDEIRDIVAYARERHVTIVPEIEMPGHARAALAAYPELACTDGPFEVATTWGVFEDVFCPGEETFAFLEGVLTEVMELFPGEMIHIGGDEAPKTRWETSEVARAVMRREGLADESELQSWFIRRIELFLNAHGRRLVGWDEILEGGLAPNATVMSWRGTAGGIEAARQGHDVVMTPTSHAYFDYYQGDPATEPLAIGGFLPLERVYAFEPVPPELEPDEALRVLGAQGNVWTEYMPTEEQVEYMLFPRLLAMAEVAWSDPGSRDFAGFSRRLPWHLRRLDALGIGYRIPDVSGLEGDRLTLQERITVTLGTAATGEIRFTLDGTDPDGSSPVYAGPIEVDLRRGPVTVSARVLTGDGRQGPVRRGTFARATPRPAALVERPLEAGLVVELLPGAFRRVEELDRREVAGRERVSRVAIPEDAPAGGFGLRFRGYLEVPEEGVYTFRLTSDDGAVLRLGGRIVVDHDGLHGASEREGQAALARGLHPLELRYFQAGGGRALALEWAGPDGIWRPLDGALLRIP